MRIFHRLFVTKILAIGLSIVLFHGGFPGYTHSAAAQAEDPTQAANSSEQLEDIFDAALEKYEAGRYETAAAKLKAILISKIEIEPTFKAKIYILLGACCEMSGNKKKAGEWFRELKKMVDEGVIADIPEVRGVEIESLRAYERTFEDTALFEFEKPKEVSVMLNKNAIYAPGKHIEIKNTEKRRKRFPWLMAATAAAILGIATILYLVVKKYKKEYKAPQIEWVKIPAGYFMMGDNFHEGDADEQPVHQVYLDEYYISKFEINRIQYIDFCLTTGRRYYFINNPADLPANFVTWNDAVSYCQWYSAKSGENIYLPTEAQWEKAARGTFQYRYPWGDDPPDAGKAYFANDCIFDEVTLVGDINRAAGCSVYGVYDMAGNVAEWCRDWYSPTYYSNSPERNPIGPALGSTRVVRGGGFCSDAFGIRSAERDSLEPMGSRKPIGFRVVKEK